MRAIILAAGMGTRLRPLTENTPKSLISIEGETLIERQIKFLRERSIEDIIIVTGYLRENFNFLIEKYDVSLVHNDKFDIYNNFYTMYLVRGFLNDAYVIDADNYLVDNFFDASLTRPTYFSAYKTDFEDEWLLKCDENNRVEDIVITSGSGTILSGVSYWNEESGEVLTEIIEDYYKNKDYSQLYWDNIVMENIDKLTIYKEEIPKDSIFEIDNLKDLEILKSFVQSKR